MKLRADASMSSSDVILPDFDLPHLPHIVSSWFASEGQRVVAGDRLLEITVRDVTIEVEAPASGTLDERCAHLGDCVAVGRRLARIRDDRLCDEQH